MTDFVDVLQLPYGAAQTDYRPGPDLGRMRAGANEAERLIAAAVADTVDGTIAPDESDIVSRIEARRAELAASSTPISYMDFGASTRDASETPEEMYRGKPVERTVGNLEQRTSKRHRAALLLMKLLRGFKPMRGLELGTCLGISAAYQGAALALNGQGRLITLDGAEPVAALARETLDGLGIDGVRVTVGRFQDILQDVLNDNGPFDYAYIDGHHDGAATVGYFEQIKPHLTARALLVFDDIRWSASMTDAWERIIADPLVSVSVDLVDMGVCYLDGAANGAARYSMAP